MGEGIFSRLFKREKKTPVAETALPIQEQPIQATPPLSSSAEERKKILEKRGQKQAQIGYKNLVEDAQAGVLVHNPPGTASAQIRESSKRVALSQSLEQARKIQEEHAPKGPAKKRFRDITQASSETKIPVPPAQQVPTEKIIPPVQTSAPSPPQEITKPTLSEQRAKELDPKVLKKALKTPPSEWERETKPTTPQEKVKEAA
jgi:hypothetical protein